MRVTQRTADALVIAEGAGSNLMIGAVLLGLGAAAAVIGWTSDQIVAAMIGMVLFAFGAKTLLLSQVRTHRFSRQRQVVEIESRGRFGADRREVPFDSIADIQLEHVKRSYYVYYLTKQGERLRWADSYDGSEEDTRECFNAAREWLGMEPKS
jgi:hypothetical protein